MLLWMSSFLPLEETAPLGNYIPSKPAKYGIKVFALVDTKNAYTSNLEVYYGKQPPGPYCVENMAKDIVLRLAKPIEGTGRNVTEDNWFSSVPLVRTLLQEKKLTYVGTVHRNKAEIPKEFLPKKDRQICSAFGFLEDCSLVSYYPKKKIISAFWLFHLCIWMVDLRRVRRRQKA
nr:unnamed protein product [Callosobruchus analis]